VAVALTGGRRPRGAVLLAAVILGGLVWVVAGDTAGQPVFFGAGILLVTLSLVVLLLLRRGRPPP